MRGEPPCIGSHVFHLASYLCGGCLGCLHLCFQYFFVLFPHVAYSSGLGPLANAVTNFKGRIAVVPAPALISPLRTLTRLVRVNENYYGAARSLFCTPAQVIGSDKSCWCI